MDRRRHHPQLDCWLAQAASEQVVGILVLRGDWIDQLYVDPNLTGRGIGAELLALAKRERPQRLRLWTFVSNEKIRSGAARSERQSRTAERSFTRGRDEKRALGRPKFSTVARQVPLPRNVLFRRRRGLVLFDQGGSLGTYAWRMHTELKSLVSMEIPDGLEGYGPDDPAHFGISVMAFLGTADSDKVDSFDVVVCTPGCMDSENR
jgi:GNAT superfamily N-acetyltransferase